MMQVFATILLSLVNLEVYPDVSGSLQDLVTANRQFLDFQSKGIAKGFWQRARTVEFELSMPKVVFVQLGAQ